MSDEKARKLECLKLSNGNLHEAQRMHDWVDQDNDFERGFNDGLESKAQSGMSEAWWRGNHAGEELRNLRRWSATSELTKYTFKAELTERLEAEIAKAPEGVREKLREALRQILSPPGEPSQPSLRKQDGSIQSEPGETSEPSLRKQESEGAEAGMTLCPTCGGSGVATLGADSGTGCTYMVCWTCAGKKTIFDAPRMSDAPAHQPQTTVQETEPAIPEGFTKWLGSQSHTPFGYDVEVLYRNGRTFIGAAGSFTWSHAADLLRNGWKHSDAVGGKIDEADDIIAYRIISNLEAATRPEASGTQTAFQREAEAALSGPPIEGLEPEKKLETCE